MIDPIDSIEDNNDIYGISQAHNSSAVSLKEREDREAIEKTNAIASSSIFAPTTSSSTLEGRVTVGDPKVAALDPKESEPTLAVEKTPLEMVKEMDPQALHALDTALNHSPGPNYLIKLQNLVGELLAQQNKISERERTKTQGTKKDYLSSNNESANLTRSLGNQELAFAALGFVLLIASQFASGQDKSLGECIKYLSENGCSGLAGLCRALNNTEQRKKDAMGQISLAEYQAATSKGASEGNSKQELIGLLEKVLESLRSASKAS